MLDFFYLIMTNPANQKRHAGHVGTSQEERRDQINVHWPIETWLHFVGNMEALQMHGHCDLLGKLTAFASHSENKKGVEFFQ